MGMVKRPTKNGTMSSLIAAVKKEDIDAVRKVLRHSQADREAVNYQDPERRATALFHACVQGILTVVQLLLSHGANLSLCTAWGATPLHAAAENGHDDITRLLVTNGASVNAQTNYGDTPLHLAAHRGHLNIVKYLVGCGAHTCVRNVKWNTPMEEAILSRHTGIASYLNNLLSSGDKLPMPVIHRVSTTVSYSTNTETRPPSSGVPFPYRARPAPMNDLSKDRTSDLPTQFSNNTPIAESTTKRRQPVESLDPTFCLPTTPSPPRSLAPSVEATLLRHTDRDVTEPTKRDTSTVSALLSTRRELELCRTLLKSLRDKELKLLEYERRLQEREAELVSLLQRESNPSTGYHSD